MHISSIRITGFRSFGSEVVIPVQRKLLAFIGHNSSGKTTALDALRKVFAATMSEREIFREDFHVAKDEDVGTILERSLSIEVRFEFSETDSDSIAHFFSDMVVNSTGSPPFLRIRLEAHWHASELNHEGDIESKLYFITVPDGTTEGEDSKRMFPNHLRQLIQILYVPAIRRPSDQIKYASGSLLYRVLRKIKWGNEFKKEFEEKITEISKLFAGLEEFNAIQESINNFWSQFHKDPRYQETNLGFGQGDLESVLKRIEVLFSPSGAHRPFRVDELGEGYRSLFYLTLVCALLEVEEKLANESDEIGINRPLITLLAIEEPENHIAPQLLGRVTKILSKIADSESAQVFLSSHTPSIVRRIEPESICHFRIDKEYQTEVNIVLLPDQTAEAYKYVREAVHHFPEMYFAKLVVIGEGDSEEIIINKLTEAFEYDFDDNLITFAPLGHRFVHHIWRLLKELKIPFVTLLDLDLEREGGGWGRIRYATLQLIKLGVASEKLLSVEGDQVLTPDDVKEMHTWTADIDSLTPWMQRLEKYFVFFSSQLDIDFLMLESYPSVYKEIVPKAGGPRIPDKTKSQGKYNAKVIAAVQATLKSESATGVTFSDAQKELMVWYQYHFLGRGKPVTHVLALSKMSAEDINANLPPVLARLFKAIKKRIEKSL